MSVFLTLTVALRAILRNRMRATLTVLGIIIGIAAVTAMVSIGQSASQLVQDQFKALGTNVIVVFPAAMRKQGVQQSAMPSLMASDSSAIARECPAVLAASPIVMAGGQLIYGNNNWSPHDMVGVGIDYLTVRNWPMAAGECFGERDVSSAAKVCVVGHTLVVKLFQTADPIGQTVRIKNIPFRVVGVLESKGANLVGEDQDDIVLMPYTTVRKRLQGSSFDDVNAIIVSARSVAQTADAQAEITQILAERHRLQPGETQDFRVQDTTEIARVLSIITGTMTLMLSSIAAISLLVGGVGIMNIMLVSVTERTREIGIRMAVGARPRDILRQFLFEAMVLSGFGGLLGLLIGVAGSIGATMLINRLSSGADWPTVISAPAALVALGFSLVVGVFFGYYPALRASRLDPIEALRYE